MRSVHHVYYRCDIHAVARLPGAGHMMHTWVHGYIRACDMRTWVHGYVRVCVHAYMGTFDHACMRTWVHAMHHACMCACVHEYMSTHAYMRTCAHAHMCDECMPTNVRTCSRTCILLLSIRYLLSRVFPGLAKRYMSNDLCTSEGGHAYRNITSGPGMAYRKGGLKRRSL